MTESCVQKKTNDEGTTYTWTIEGISNRSVINCRSRVFKVEGESYFLKLTSAPLEPIGFHIELFKEYVGSFNVSVMKAGEKKAELRFPEACGPMSMLSDLQPLDASWLENDSLVLCIEIPMEKNRQVSQKEPIPPPPEACAVDYASFWNTHELSDFVVVCNSVQFKCHKLVLANSSKVFRSMIAQDMKENHESKVTITDPVFDEGTVEDMLVYMYSRKVPQDPSTRDGYL